MGRTVHPMNNIQSNQRKLLVNVVEDWRMVDNDGYQPTCAHYLGVRPDLGLEALHHAGYQASVAQHNT